jgi:hypothetical protein
MKDFHAFPPIPPCFFLGLLLVFFAIFLQVLMLWGESGFHALRRSPGLRIS